MKNKKPFVSIIICTQNRAESLNNLSLKSLLKLDYPNYEVIIVDDNSKDNTRDIAEKYSLKIKNLKYIKNKKNKGLCYVRNLGIKNSKGKIIAFTDDDCIIHKDWIKELVKIYEKNKNIIGVGGKILIKNTNKQQNALKEIFGCNMSFKKEILSKFSFDTNLYFNKCSYYDETELINRIKNTKHRIIYSPKPIVRHFSHPAEYRKNQKIGDPLNLIYIYAKNHSLKDYYSFIFNAILFNKYQSNDKIYSYFIEGIDKLKGASSPKNYKNWIMIPKVVFILLIKIPYKVQQTK